VRWLRIVQDWHEFMHSIYLQERGEAFYQTGHRGLCGMIIGENARDVDLNVT